MNSRMDSTASSLQPTAFRDSGCYREAVEFLFGRIDYERAPKMPYTQRDLNLSRMRRLLDMLGNPHEQVRVIHVAGTKGKGSTTAILSSVLSAAGFRCGAYTSPHLHHVEERFVIGEHACSPETFAQLIDRVRPMVCRLDKKMEGQGPTYFEIATAMAFDFFAREMVDVAVVEVGLGGRLDSTNVCKPLVSVITSISYDHTRQLGNTLEAIAKEKAGIIKPGVPVISGAFDSEAKRAIASVAAQHRSPLRQAGVDFGFRYQPPQDVWENPTSFVDFEICEQGHWQTLRASIPLGLLGRHQAANAAVAIAAIDALPDELAVSERAIHRGCGSARCPARVEVVASDPLTVVDAAHNVASVKAFVSVLKESFPNPRKSLLLATTRGKDVEGMLRVLLGEFDRVVCTRYLNNPRASDPQSLCALARSISAELDLACADRIECCDTPAAAWRQLIAETLPTDLVCVTGSFFIAAEIRDLVRAR